MVFVRALFNLSAGDQQSESRCVVAAPGVSNPAAVQ